MTIFNELIKTCHSDLALFASPVCEMMTLLLSSADPEFKAAGTETVGTLFRDFWSISPI